MNNDAFRNLVNERSKSKTTKEIAREAVELEFREKSQKRNRKDKDNNGYDSSDDDGRDKRSQRRGGGGDGGGIDGSAENSTMDDGEETYWKQGRRIKKKARASKGDDDPTGSGGGKYRDRAKERREGKNLDYDSITTDIVHAAQDGAATNSAPTVKYSAEMTKFLGGDEAHTHLVKGLDKALAEKVRREEMPAHGEEPTVLRAATLRARNRTPKRVDVDLEDLDTLIEHNAKLSKNTTAALSKMPLNALLQTLPQKVHTQLGKDLLTYIQQTIRQKTTSSDTPTNTTDTETNISTAGQTILRSTLSFSTKANPRDRRNAWEMPHETITSSARHEGLDPSRRSKGATATNTYFCFSPIKGDLQCKLKDVFGAAIRVQEKKEAQKHKRKKSKKTKEGRNTHNRSGSVYGAEGSVEVDAIQDSPIVDSDDDIFGGIGEYVPPQSSAIKKS